MKSLAQRLLAVKIEYHWWRIHSLRKKTKSGNFHKTACSENLHRYKANKASLEYEISAGLRNYRGEWQNVA